VKEREEVFRGVCALTCFANWKSLLSPSPDFQYFSLIGYDPDAATTEGGNLVSFDRIKKRQSYH